MNHRRFLIIALIAFSSLPALAQSNDRAVAQKEIESLRAQIKQRENLLLQPAAEDLAAYVEFLQQPGTGLIRLLPREKNDGVLTLRGGGAYYSFARLTHEYGRGSDVAFEQGHLSVGFAGADYGMMAKLGNIPLEEATPENPVVSNLAQYKPPTSEPEARAEYRKFSEENYKKDSVFKTRMTAIVGNTYALRSINFDNSDVLVAFKILREDEDGSLILTWKMLKKYPTPRLER